MCRDDYLDHPEEFAEPPERSRFGDDEDSADEFAAACAAAGYDTDGNLLREDDDESDR